MNPGDELHSFVIKETLGHGGMGGVYVGENKDTGELVAIKTLFEEFSKDEAYVRRFQREASVYRQLNHPNIVKFISSGFDKDVYFIAMEHIAGNSLDELLKDGVEFTLEDVLLYISDLASAIYHAHSKGIIHRDIKPQNIMIRNDGVVKLLDFGVAQTDDDLVKTATGSIVGTFFYSSPEQNHGHKIDERSDLYSLGLVFYEMLTGQRALSGSNPLEVATTQRLGEIKPPLQIKPSIPDTVSNVVMRLLEKDPNQRFQSARDLENHLKRCSGSSTEVAPPISSQMSSTMDKESEIKWSRAKEAFARRELDKALELALELVNKGDERGEIHCFLGKIHAARGFSYNAIEEFKKAIASEPSNYQFKLDYAVALYSLNLIDKSKEEFERVIELDKENPFARQYLQLIAETDNSRNNTIPDVSRSRQGGSFNLSESSVSTGNAAFLRKGVRTQTPSPGIQGTGAGSDYASLSSFVPPPVRTTPPSQPAVVPPVRTAPPPQAAVPPPVRTTPPSQPAIAPPVRTTPSSQAAVPPPPSAAKIPPPNRSIKGSAGNGALVPPPGRSSSSDSFIPPPSRGSSNQLSTDYSVAQSPREAVLGRNAAPPESAAKDLFPPKSERKKSSEPKQYSKGRRSKNPDDSDNTFDPETARFWTYVWWGAGKLYSGSISEALVWTGIEIFILLLVLLPLQQIFYPQLGLWQNPQLDMKVFERKIVLINDPNIRNGLRAVVSPIASSSLNNFLKEHSKNHLHLLMLAVGSLLFLWYEMKLPALIYRKILIRNMRGKIIEVRQDLTIKINIGESRGVKAGYIFTVKKKKHINQVNGGAFKTMVTAPSWFTAGKAKVMSTASSFSICKFKRLSGEASNPSVGDAVVVMKCDL